MGNYKIMRFYYFTALNKKSKYTEHSVSLVSDENQKAVWEESRPTSHSFDHLTYWSSLPVFCILSHLTLHPLQYLGDGIP